MLFLQTSPLHGIGFCSFSGFLDSCVIGNFSMLKGVPLFLRQCFFSRSTKGQLKVLNGLAVVLSANFQINLGARSAFLKNFIGLNHFPKRKSGTQYRYLLMNDSSAQVASSGGSYSLVSIFKFWPEIWSRLTRSGPLSTAATTSSITLHAHQFRTVQYGTR